MSYLEMYLFLNVVIALTGLLSLGLAYMLRRFLKKVSAAQITKIHYTALFFATFSIFAFNSVSPGVSSWSSSTHQSFSSPVVKTKRIFLQTVQKPVATSNRYEFNSLDVLKLILVLGFFFNLIHLVIGIYKTRRFLKSGFLYKKVGCVSLYLSERSATPFAFTFLNQSYVSLPISLLGDQKNFQISVKHELQHLRNRDTRFSYMGSFLKAVFFVNPFVTLWVKQINSRSELKRRIKEMSKEKKSVNRWVMSIMLTGVLSLVSVSAYAFVKHAGLGKLDQYTVEKIVDRSQFSKGFPVDVNEQVVDQLNRLIKTSKGKKIAKRRLRAYKKYKDFIHRKAAEYNLPSEIAAVAFVESGFTNPKQKSRGRSAGMWQFIYSTGQAYGLVVDGKDLRTDVPAATDAAMRYLSSLNLVFADLRLAMLSYNAGEHAVVDAIQKNKTRDPWTITQSDLRYDRGYLAKVIAAAIVIKNPNLVK